ncbi:hypothetical protein SAMN05444714_2007 [Yoonia litorea]|uniref:Uncharacterized protein n=2 Tax=Yoonia litorea TaxID=1123755 RepID=A0A1I6MLP1_9RHOB|nr:hypothetical protein SAMN05444714_2007 [Yoonia litorea]
MIMSGWFSSYFTLGWMMLKGIGGLLVLGCVIAFVLIVRKRLLARRSAGG